MKNIKILLLLLLPVIMFSCSKMEDNYKDYLLGDSYAPKVLNLSVQNYYKSVELNWELPNGNLETVVVRYDDMEINAGLVESIVISELEVKGYTFNVVSIDKNGFESVPASVYAFPSGEE